jgi:nitrogen-specific signal transduction histidine kinase
MALPGSSLIRFGRRAPTADRGADAPSSSEIMAAMATAVLVIDPEGQVAEINAACESLFNLSRNQIVGRGVLDAIGHPLTTMPSDAPFAAYDIDVVLPGQRRMRVDLMVAPLPDRLGWRAVSIHGHARSTIGARSIDREGGTRTAVAAAAMLAHEVKNPLSAVLGHRDSLIQILINLLKNAAEAMGDGPGAITLTTAYRHGVSMRRADGDARQPLPIELCVIDEGPGAPPEIEGHLFDPFVTTKRTGSGLGLALVEKLVSDQGGIIEYAREGTPSRTVFRLLLPRARVMA